MRNYLLAAVAAVAMATPALAKDQSPYVGIEGGLVIDADIKQDVTLRSPTTSTKYNNGYDVDFKRGLDADVIAGYDFGLIRAEAELGYKRLRADKIKLSNDFRSALGTGADTFDVSGHGNVKSLMANALFDWGDEGHWSAYAGAGAGRAKVKFGGESDSAFAWQLIAGVRKPISNNVDLGLKYRFFRTGKLSASDSFTNGTTVVGINSDGKFRSHSLLASLVYNFGAPAPVIAPAPVVETPPPPPPPATQTCADGSVILASDLCPPPAAVQAPPPPPPAPERG